MNAAELLRDLAGHGVTVRLSGDRLALRGTVPAELLAACREHKPAILAQLREDAALALACHRCGARPKPGEVGGYDALGWRCAPCLDVAGLLCLVPSYEPRSHTRRLEAAPAAAGSGAENDPHDAAVSDHAIVLRAKL
jgi:hypothetical protein